MRGSVLGSLRALRTLDLAFTRIGAGGAAAVARLELLRVLNLRCGRPRRQPRLWRRRRRAVAPEPRRLLPWVPRLPADALHVTSERAAPGAAAHERG
jgi:hypothetical protein